MLAMIPTALLSIADLAGRRRDRASERASKPCAIASPAVIRRVVLKALLHAVSPYTGRGCQRRGIHAPSSNGGSLSDIIPLKRHQWVFRASTLGRSAGWQGSQGHMCGAFSSPKTVILRRAPDRLSTISTTGSCTGQTTMSLRGLSARLGASLALDRQSSRVVADVACGW